MRPIYIREAYRLLQQSIIFVESEDIELDADPDAEVFPSLMAATACDTVIRVMQMSYSLHTRPQSIKLILLLPPMRHLWG